MQRDEDDNDEILWFTGSPQGENQWWKREALYQTETEMEKERDKYEEGGNVVHRAVKKTMGNSLPEVQRQKKIGWMQKTVKKATKKT